MQTIEVVLPPHRFHVVHAGSGTPVVLIHGLGGSSDWFQRNISVIAESHSVYAVDLVGFGRNRFFLRRSALPLAFDDIAALLARWISTSIGTRVHLAGNSMGGQIAIHLAATRPDLVRSLVLIDSTGIPFELDPRRHIEAIAVPHGWMSFARVLVRDLFRAGPASFAMAFARLLRDDARPLMRALRMPVLLIWGAHDPLVPLSYAHAMAGEIAGARLVVVDRAGHVPMWENPTAFNGALLSFVNAVDRDDAAVVAERRFSWGLAGFHDGIAHREAGARCDVVLIHGLGMSSRYFEQLARALHERGLDAWAPDLKGFGSSENAPAMTPAQHADLLTTWADTMRVSRAVWVGHSTGCSVIAAVSVRRPDLVHVAVGIAPLWSATQHPHLRSAAMLFADAFREPVSLYRFVLPEYWRCGLARWVSTWRKQVDAGIRDAPPAGRFVFGKRDPLVDRERIRGIAVPGAHACFVTDAEACAAAIADAVNDAHASS